MKRVLQVVPRLPPAISGVGDYALRLAHEWRQAHGLAAEFLVTDSDWPGGDSWDGFRVHRLSRRDARGLVSCLEQPEFVGVPVLLHYVGYAYARRGAPLWLVQGLRQWARRAQRPHLVVFFHELFASGPPWTSSFWLSPAQRWMCRELGRLAASRFTNRAASAGWLDRWSGGSGQTWVLPVFSNLGEPVSLPPLAERELQLVIYGGLARNPSDGAFAAAALRRVMKQLGLNRVVSFGPREVRADEMGVPVENLGLVSPERASVVLLQSRGGYLDYFDGYLGKSGIFAAYCAHGVVPVLLRANYSELDGLVAGEHFLVASGSGGQALRELGQPVASAAANWYCGHTVGGTAGVLAQQITTRTTTAC